MHILFLTDNFPPEGNAPASRTYEHAREWVQAGHQVTIITGVPNFPEGKVFPGYKNKWYQVEQMEGIEVRRVKTYITANEGFVKRTLDYISFMVTGVIAGLFVKKPDVVVATSPQFFCAQGGWLLSALRRVPFVFELRDLWPASITAVGAMKKSRVIGLLEKIEMFLYRKASVIISVTNSFRKELISRGIDGDKIKVVLNGVDSSKFMPQPAKDSQLVEQLSIKDKFVVGYIGTHGLAHALESIVDTAERLKERGDIIFLFAGGGAARQQVEQYAQQKGLDNIRFLAKQPKERMPAVWSLCDVSLVHLRNVELFRSVIPSKIFESMGMGLPMIIGVPEGEATGIVRDAQAGLVVEPENAEQIEAAVLALADNSDECARYKANSLASAADYSRQVQAKKMLEIIREECGSAANTSVSAKVRRQRAS